MTDSYQTDDLSDETDRYLYDRAMDIGGISDVSVRAFVEDCVADMRDSDTDYAVDDGTLRQAALEAAAEATQTMAEDGYHDHL